jgi:hypothetical protein
MNNLTEKQVLSLLEKVKTTELLFLNNFENKDNEKYWVLEFKKPELNLLVYSFKNYNKPIKKFKATTFVKNASPKQFIEYIENFNKRVVYDNNFKSLKKIPLKKSNDDEIFILQTETNQIGVVSSREFIDLSLIKNLDNGNIIFCGSSIELNDIFPYKQNSVRGVNYEGSGWFIQKDNLINGFRLTLIVETDLKGWFPSVVTNNSICYGLIGIFTGIHKEFSLNPK